MAKKAATSNLQYDRPMPFSELCEAIEKVTSSHRDTVAARIDSQVSGWRRVLINKKLITPIGEKKRQGHYDALVIAFFAALRRYDEREGPLTAYEADDFLEAYFDAEPWALSWVTSRVARICPLPAGAEAAPHLQAVS